MPTHYPQDLAQARRYLQEDEPGAVRGGLLPLMRGADGSLSLAVPQMLRDAGVGLLDLLAGTRTGDVTPEATAALFDVAGGGAASAGLRGAAGQLGMSGGRLARAADALPMDEASRMARALEMGFNPDDMWLHGTADNFDAFDLRKAGARAGSKGQKAAFLTKDTETASHFAQNAGVRDPLPGEKPHKIIPGATGRDDMPLVYDGSNVMPLMHRAQNVKVVDSPYYNTAEFEKAIKAARKKGHDAVLFRGVKGEGGDQLAVLDPTLLRSRFAAFDPAKRDSADLLAARIGTGTGPLGLLQSMQDDPRKRKQDRKDRPKRRPLEVTVGRPAHWGQ